MKIKLAPYIKSPDKLIDYYTAAFSDPMTFPQKIDFDEDPKDSVLFFLILGAVSSVLSFVTHFSISAVITSLIFLPVVLLVGSGITFLISSFCKAKLSFINAVNICVHTFVVLFPLSLLSTLLPSISVLVFLVQMFFWGNCIVSVWNADLKRVIIVSILCTLLIVLPIACSLMVMPVVNTFTKSVYGTSASDLMKTVEKLQVLNLPCIEKYGDSKSRTWTEISMQIVPMLYTLEDENRENMVRSSIERIDKILEREHDLSRGQLKCVRKYQKTLEGLL